MKILFTFEFPTLMLRSEDYINLLLSFGHDVFLYSFNKGNIDQLNWMKSRIQKKNFHVLLTEPKINDYEGWYYDLTSSDWRYPSIIARDIVDYRSNGFLACINYEDGYQFFDDRITDSAKARTSLFMNNSLFIDRDRYPKYVKDKVFLTTSYITNSQKFKHETIPYKFREKRVIFSGSVTGQRTILSNYSEYEENLRFLLCKRILEDPSINSIIRFTNYEPIFKHHFENIPDKFKSKTKSETEFVDEMVNSCISLAIKGNSYPTNRFFESQAAGCVTFSNKLDGEVEIYGVGNKNEDYIEIDVTGDDLIEKINRYLSNDVDAERISNNGRKTWERYNMLNSEGVYTEETKKYHIEGIKKITGWDIRSL